MKPNNYDTFLYFFQKEKSENQSCKGCKIHLLMNKWTQTSEKFLSGIVSYECLFSIIQWSVRFHFVFSMNLAVYIVILPGNRISRRFYYFGFKGLSRKEIQNGSFSPRLTCLFFAISFSPYYCSLYFSSLLISNGHTRTQ